MADSQRKTANIASNILINDTSAQYATILMFDADLEADTTYTLSFTASANIRMYMSEAIFTQATYLRTVDGVNTVTVITKADLVKTSTNYQNGRWLVAKNTVEQSVSIDITNVMLNTGSTPLPYEPYGWQHSLRKLTTATDTFTTLPVDIYADGNNATVGLKGNTVQNGTPTPDNPIMPQSCGERTGNLYNINAKDVNNGYVNNAQLNQDGTHEAWTSAEISEYIPISGDTAYTFNGIGSYNSPCYALYDENKQLIGAYKYSGRNTINFTSSNNARYFRFSHIKIYTQAMVVEGTYTSSRMPKFEPYGYKIPISSGQQTTNIYLTEQLMKIGDTADSLVSTGTVTYNIKKLVLTGNEEYSNDWRPATGTYAALIKISNTIPESNNVIPICTHLQGKHYDYLFSGEVGVSRVPSSVYCIAIRVPDTIAANQSELVSWLAAQYTNGTPVIVYYVIATAKTETVAAPSIPTTEGANSITVDTTVQPSEFTATWTGWHDAECKEWDDSDWQ